MKPMTVEELIALLEDQDPAAEVRFAWQPSYPLESSFAHRVVAFKPDTQAPDSRVYLAAGEHSDYLPGWVAQELGWQ